MYRLLNSTVALILGTILFLIGCIQPSKYENAIESGYEVDAKIVEVKSRESEMETETITKHTVYADYEVDGKEYKHIKIGNSLVGDEWYVGNTVKIVVDPENPQRALSEGGILCTIGFVIAAGAIIVKLKNRKKKSATV